MSTNGALSPNGSHTDYAASSSASPRTSLDSERPLNGAGDGRIPAESLSKQELETELEKTREEKDALESQYRNLVAKLNTMRTTLGTKLKQDAEELDRREQLLQQLSAENEDLVSTVDTLKSELVSANDDAERAARELDRMRTAALQENAQEANTRERELRETQAELERVRMERDEWEQYASQSRMREDEARAEAETARRELEIEIEARTRQAEELVHERDKAANLQSVLEDFQSAKDRELRRAVDELEAKLTQVTQSLAEYKHRAHTAELELEASASTSSRTPSLEREVKEKTLLINKLRHEAVILNEHLLEALRRLRRSASDTNVDRRLVTNVVLQYITTPRGDSKRFEMLQLLASILAWGDAERARAGLQRDAGGAAGGVPNGILRSASQGQELEKTDETESFSKLWVEYLLTEAGSVSPASGSPKTPSRASLSLPRVPSSPTRPSPTQTQPSGGGSWFRVPSFGSNLNLASTPDITLTQPRKGSSS